MKVSIKPKFFITDIEKSLGQLSVRFDEAIINRLRFIGEKFVLNARSNKTYKDNTGNLRSSIKYFILKNGRLYGAKYTKAGKLAKNQDPNSDFVIRPVFTKDGKLAKKQPFYLGGVILDKVAKEYPNGYVLLCIAGMEYASYVESKNLDVITASSFIVEEDLRNALDELEDELK
ncbi:MAG TPA: hypothetical protein VFF23_00145 [Hanamia sp.]|nr:hypothetical protein [Hanamia sp.]